MRESTSHIIHLDLLKENLSKIQNKVDKSILFMVKANAYGHGLLDIVKFSHSECEIENFGLATIGEYLKLKENGLLSPTFYIFSELNLSQYKSEYNSKVIPVISNVDDLEIFVSSKEFEDVPLCLKVNTGMNRLGFEESELKNVIRLIKDNNRLEIFHLMSHFSCSSLSIEKDQRSKLQKEKFENIIEFFKSEGFKILNRSMANSGAIEQGFATEYEFVRPGIMVYGPSSLIERDKKCSWWDGKLISSLQCEVLSSKILKRGEPIGYGAHILGKDSAVVILSIGYGDGIRTDYQNTELVLNGVSGQILGRVNMDMLYFVTSTENIDKFRKGNVVKIWEDSISQNFENIIKNSGSIPYEVLCQLSVRLPKRYEIKSSAGG